uniref:Chitin elicitor-binding protein n=1 Tax=Aegilops tauschii TaxID=37682 RepID=M8BG23_AEGTA
MAACARGLVAPPFDLAASRPGKLGAGPWPAPRAWPRARDPLLLLRPPGAHAAAEAAALRQGVCRRVCRREQAHCPGTPPRRPHRHALTHIPLLPYSSRRQPKQNDFYPRCTPRGPAPQSRDTPPKRDTGIASEKEWGINLLDEAVKESGTNEDGSTWYRESGEDLGENGYRCRWARMGGQTHDGSTEWKETWWEKSDWTGYKELGAQLLFIMEALVRKNLGRMLTVILGGRSGKKFCTKTNGVRIAPASGQRPVAVICTHFWHSICSIDYSTIYVKKMENNNLARLEKSAEKQAKSGTENAGWWEKYDAKGWTEKGAHKYGRLNEQSWWERWGEHYDGRGSVLKWTDKWAETDLGTRWGDKWEEKFFAGIGSRQGETWHASPGGDRWSRTWGEEHFGNGKVHKYGKSTTGESWDLVVDEETYYEADPHYGWADVVGDSSQLLSIQPVERPPGLWVMWTAVASGVETSSSLQGVAVGNRLTQPYDMVLAAGPPFKLGSPHHVDPVFLLETKRVAAKQTVRIPFRCLCAGNGVGQSDHAPVYTVQPQDGLYAIARDSFDAVVTYQEIATANKIADVNLITVGQKLWIPLPCSCDPVDGAAAVFHLAYIVDGGETTSGIAATFGVTEDTLLKLNKIADPKTLQKDQVLDVPLPVCSSSISNTSDDHDLRLPNGTYTLTAQDCIQCRCSSNTFQLNCTAVQGKKGCPAVPPCSEGLNLGQTSGAGCDFKMCAYSGYSNSSSLSIQTTLFKNQTAPACEKAGSLRSAFAGSMWRISAISFHMVLILRMSGTSCLNKAMICVRFASGNELYSLDWAIAIKCYKIQE